MLCGQTLAQVDTDPNTRTGLDPEKAIHHYVHQTWTMRDGLPSNTVRDIDQTPDGYLWLATHAGLVRFDGVRFKTYDTRSTPAAPSNFMTTLATTRDGALWIGTRGNGLLRFRDGEFTVWDTAAGLSGNTVEALVVSSDRDDLFIAAGGQLHRLVDGRVSVVERPEGMTAGWITSVSQGPDGAIWMTTAADGLLRWQGSEWSRLTPEPGVPADRLSSVHADRTGTVWIAEGSPGPAHLYRLIDGRFVDDSAAEGGPTARPQMFMESRDGTLWIAFAGGVSRFRGGRFESHHFEAGTDRRYKSLFEDREGNLWMGTYGTGLQRLANGPVTTFSAHDGLVGAATAVYEDRRGDLWVGTETGLYFFRGDHFTAVDGISAPVRSIGEDNDGTLWVGTVDALVRLEAWQIERYPMDHPVTLISAHRDGGILVGQFTEGVRLFRDGRVTDVESLRGQQVRWTLRSPSGARWFGTNHSGLLKLENGKSTWFTTADGLASDAVLSVHRDDQGVMWIGTEGSGLNRLADDVFRHYSSGQGLKDDSVWPILGDDDDNLWIGGDQGLSRIAKGDLEKLDAGEISSIPIVSYGVADGMKSPEGVGYGDPSAIRTRDGRLWFATTKGVSMIDLRYPGRDPVPPAALIEELTINGAPPPFDDLRATSSSPAKLEVHFTVLDFHKPDQIEFRYRLGPESGGWSEVGTERHAALALAHAGAYEFQVQARHPLGPWGDVARTGFTIAPVPVQTWWFRLLAAAALVVVVVWIVRSAVRGVLERNEALRREITRRQQVEDRLEESQALSNAAFDSLASAVAVIDANGIILQVNETWQQLARLNNAEDGLVRAVGVDYFAACRSAVGPELPLSQRVVAGLRHALAHRTAFDIEYDFASPDGDWRRFLLRAVPMAGPEPRLVVSHIDITEPKLLERELAHSQRVAALGELVGALSHEIGQPLTAIMSNTTAAIRLAESDDPDLQKLRPILGDLLDDERRATGVLKRLRGLLQKQPEPEANVDLNRLLVDTRDLLLREAGVNGVVLHLEPGAERAAVWGDAVQLQQVMINLAVNGIEAMKTTPAGSRVLTAKTSVDGGHVTLSVSDTGEGIDQKSLGELFTPFYTTKPGGLGIGLSVSRRIVESHGGQLWAENNPGGGATFHMSLPRARQAPPE